MENECDWFANCHEPAEHEVEHPTLGWTGICTKHLEWLGDEPSPTMFVPPLAAAALKRHPQVAALMAGEE